jgi:hypothetical protein
MNIIKILKFLKNAKNEHFLSVDYKTYKRWSLLIKLTIRFNKNYRGCKIYRKKFKKISNIVVVALKYSGKNIKRRTSGFAKEFVKKNRNSTCLYCGNKLTMKNATADHIIPISKGGNNSQVNMIVCCKSCNEERGNIKFEKYLAYKNSKYKNIKFI